MQLKLLNILNHSWLLQSKMEVKLKVEVWLTVQDTSFWLIKHHWINKTWSWRSQEGRYQKCRISAVSEASKAVFCLNWWWWLFPRLRGLGVNVQPFIPSLHFFLSPSSRWRLACTYIFHPLHQDQSTVAQWAEMTVVKCSLTSCVWACFHIGSHTMPGKQHSQSTPTSLGPGCTRV